MNNLVKFKKIIILFILIISLTSLLIWVVYDAFFKNKIVYEKINQINNLKPEENKIFSDNSITPIAVFINSPLNGVLLEESNYNSLKEKPFLAVIIQNHIDSRPQYGLNEADIVYEALVESNITRFMAIYWSNQASRIQSIRSARQYFVDLLGDYNNPVFMHVGYASCFNLENCDKKVDSLYLMNKYGIRRLSDQVSKITGIPSYSRDLECQKFKTMEHCVYSSTDRLWNISYEKMWKNDLSNYYSWKFSDEGDLDGLNLKKFIIHFKSYKDDYDPNYSVIWTYNSEDDLYYRYTLDGKPFLDANGNQIYAKSVVFQKVYVKLTNDDKGRIYQDVFGSGQGYIMQGGKVFSIKWTKPDFKTKTRFINSKNNQDFNFKRGKVWINIVPNHYDYEVVE